MNKQEMDIMNCLLMEPFTNQRVLSEISGHSLGIVNRVLKELIRKGLVNENMRPTPVALKEIKAKAPKNAIILAAGYGMRMVPINMEIPKGLLEVKGEILIERTINQLHEVGIKEIYVVVGFMKEKYEYLIDEYGVELIVNSDYNVKNNLYSMLKVLDHLSNSYVIPCDIWCNRNPYQIYEQYSWYMVSDRMDKESSVRVNRKMELVTVTESVAGNTMIGISYLVEDDAKFIRDKIRALCKDIRNDNAFWEKALFKNNKMIVSAKVTSSTEVIEINTYEQLRDFDSDSNQLKIDAMEVICNALNVDINEIVNITVLKKGMTNRSFIFSCKDKRYIMRIPGEGTDKLINRRQEAYVYQTISEKKICDEIAYINPQNGYKITEFMENARVCDVSNRNEVRKCMARLKEFHDMKLRVDHEFDIFKQIEFYETLWEGRSSVYKDYKKTKEKVMSLKPIINKFAGEMVLTHIDAVPDNFLIVPKNGKEEIYIIDWEYAGMQDPHVDIAMFCIYALYNKCQVDEVITDYFTEGCSIENRIKIYCYISVCGLLWSNWCEYKRNLGIEFGEYSLKQYRYAKDFYQIVQEEIKELEGKEECIL